MEDEYKNWLTSEQLEDTPERKEGFAAGWEYHSQIVNDAIRKVFR